MTNARRIPARIAWAMETLAVEGTLALFFEPPSGPRASGIAETVGRALAASGFGVTTVRASGSNLLIGVIGRMD